MVIKTILNETDYDEIFNALIMDFDFANYAELKRHKYFSHRGDDNYEAYLYYYYPMKVYVLNWGQGDKYGNRGFTDLCNYCFYESQQQAITHFNRL